MKPPAQTGTLVLASWLGLCLVGCETADSQGGARADAAPTTGSTAGDARAATPSDAASAGDVDAARATTDATSAACNQHSDCVIIPRGCCAACSPTKADYIAASATQADGVRRSQCPAGPVACSPCPPAPDQPLTPSLHAACIAQHCEVVDLREQEVSRCAQDSDCELHNAGCCPSCDNEPRSFVSLRVAADPAVLACFPVPPCDPCASSNPPKAYCAADGHCAVRRAP